ncbi:MAG: dephospho-CoA kinase, partial [Clostridia bacterium]|nr:dephospho-CoA kinase [Clostridia bacterium]
VEMLREVLGEVEVDSAVIHGLDKNAQAASPGMKYKHYSPKANIVIADMSLDDYVELLKNNPDYGALCFEGEEKLFENKAVTFGREYDGDRQAQRLFAALNELDELGINRVYSRRVQKHEVGLAVFNRLVRSAGFNIIHSDVNIIGLTGKTGAGKSFVSKIFKNEGCAVIDCDAVTKLPDLYGEKTIDELAETFGETVRNSDGTLNRRETARLAFSEEGGKEKLQAITFPCIIGRINDMISQAIADGIKTVVLDAPTLFEAGIDRKCSRIVVVDAPEELRLERITRRDNISREDALIRMSAQRDLTPYADAVIYADGNTDLEMAVKAILEDLR